MIPAYVRGTVVDGPPAVFTSGGEEFTVPDPLSVVDGLTLDDPVRMGDLAALSTQDVIDVLAAVGKHLTARMDGVCEQLARWSDLTPALLRSTYAQLPGQFEPELLHEVAERCIGVAHLDGWADHGLGRVRAFGARAVHVIAGNNPVIAAMTIARNALVRGDAVIKTPSNDPVTAPFLARMVGEVAPGHPLATHLAVAYWRGGDERVERRIYHPGRVEKIVAWGGFASVQHVVRYVQPGLELVTLDPKLSATVVGPEAFATPEAMTETARLAAADVGLINQEACFNARVVYVVTDARTATAWGAALYEELLALPERVSTPARRYDPELAGQVAAVRTSPDFYRVFGGRAGEGAVVVSQLDEPVDFADALSGRTCNVVPVASWQDAVRRFTAYTQTVGVWPDSLKDELREVAPLYGAQRLVSLGYATHIRPELPQDAMEPLRRMVKWVVDESYEDTGRHPFEQLGPSV